MDALAEFEPRALHFVVELQPHPEALLHAEEAGQAEIILRRTAATPILHLREMGGKDAGGLRDVLLGGGPFVQSIAKRFRKGVGKGHGFHNGSVVVGDLDLVGRGWELGESNLMPDRFPKTVPSPPQAPAESHQTAASRLD